MNKGFVLTGVLFGLAIILLISTNYFLLSSSKNTDYLVLQVDAVNNRKTDVRRIIKSAIDNGYCDSLQELINNPLLDSNNVNVSINSIDLSECSNNNPVINVSINSSNVYEELIYP